MSIAKLEQKVAEPAGGSDESRRLHVVHGRKQVNLPAAETVDPFDDAADSRLAAGIEESGNDAANIAGEGDRQPPDVQRVPATLAVC